ncbi:hypothetical protein FVEN_g4032 [Fusarium venenatum]|nr:hypothetical protein FVEN_g4032 [Fusarium venenatum]
MDLLKTSSRSLTQVQVKLISGTFVAILPLSFGILGKAPCPVSYDPNIATYFVVLSVLDSLDALLRFVYDVYELLLTSFFVAPLCQALQHLALRILNI